MNKIIICVAGLVLGVYLSIGGCQSKNNQTKPENQENVDSQSVQENVAIQDSQENIKDPERKEYDPRLILPEGEAWLGITMMGHDTLSYHADGTFTAIFTYINKRNNGTLKGTWYTRNDTLFEGPYNFAPSKYSITSTQLIRYNENDDQAIYQRVNK